MIIVLFGQPHSGKTTLAKKLLTKDRFLTSVHIDGDNLRDLFQNKDYSREGRIKNLNRASDIAVFINSIHSDVILSLIYPYQETRDYLNSLCKDVVWIYLTYDEIRGRENFHLKEFEIPIDVLTLNTSSVSVEKCLVLIEDEIVRLE